MDILHSLRTGGSFIYSPGLPFIEQYLPVEQFSIEKQVVSASNRILEDTFSNPDRQPDVVKVTKLQNDQQVP
jgi:hypothetical protein